MGCYWAAMCKRKELENFLIPYTNTNSNRLKTEIQDLEHKTLIKKIDKVLSITNLKFLKENTGDLFRVIGPDRDFLGMTSKVQATKKIYTKGTTYIKGKKKTFVH